MHLRNLDDADAFTTLDGSQIRELAGAVSLPAAHQSLAEATVPPGTATERHLHRRTEELYLFVAGRGRMHLADEQQEVRPGDCVVIPPGAAHHLVNTGDEPLRLLCCCSPPYSHEDTVLVTER